DRRRRSDSGDRRRAPRLRGRRDRDRRRRRRAARTGAREVRAAHLPRLMERVVGIGGVFVRPRDTEALRRWYADHLGIDDEGWGGKPFVAEQGDVTVWAIFGADTDYWPGEQQAMVNFRVRDLDAMLEQLRAAGVEVAEATHEDDNGRFG